MGNYLKGVWDWVSNKALDTEAAHIEADSQLSNFPEVDHSMDSLQEVGYVFVEWIVKESTDPNARQAARQALAAFVGAEVVEAVNEVNVSEGHEAVKTARIHNREVIGIAERHRIEDARVRTTSGAHP